MHNPSPRFGGRRPYPEQSDLDRRERLTEKIVTTGVVLRQAIDRTLGFPADAPEPTENTARAAFPNGG